MINLPKSLLSTCGWLKEGTPDDSMVISSRIRLARNIEGIPFSQWASSTDLKRIAEQSKSAISECEELRDCDILCMEELEPIDRHFLAERYMISREFAKSGIERYAAIHNDQTISIMMNEEDHMRLQVLLAGSNLRKAWQLIDTIDQQLEKKVTFAFTNQLGYLTACPTNVGTGIRCSVMVHLPALVITRKIDKVLSAVSQIGLTVRGLSGEGSEIAGNLFQISNQWTLGISEIETIEKINKILDQIVDQEKRAQEQIIDESKSNIEDRVYRAFAILQHARIMNSNEAIELLSSIRLGRSLGIFSKPSYESINNMIIQVRPAHLQKKADKLLSTEERDEYRADMIRQWVSNGNFS
jgi:protein arginine kinase